MMTETTSEDGTTQDCDNRKQHNKTHQTYTHQQEDKEDFHRTETRGKSKKNKEQIQTIIYNHKNIQLMGGILLPKTSAQTNEPIIYLAGPILNAPEWQDEASLYILKKEPNIIIATPRSGIRDTIQPYIITEEQDKTKFPRQVAWEKEHLTIASRTGAILFWLPEQKKQLDEEEKVYGALTRVEIGQWMTEYKHDPRIHICFGTDGKFSEIDQIQWYLQQYAPDKKIHATLEETCDEAIRIATT